MGFNSGFKGLRRGVNWQGALKQKGVKQMGVKQGVCEYPTVVYRL
jgi:hypothetical protein